MGSLSAKNASEKFSASEVSFCKVSTPLHSELLDEQGSPSRVPTYYKSKTFKKSLLALTNGLSYPKK
jgi:hypothetical protein